MAWLFINTFHGGINTDDARLKRNEALKMENLDISKNGLMKKRLGYTDLGLTGTPATMNTIFEWRNSVNDEQNMIVEETSSDVTRIHHSVNNASFVIVGAGPGNELGMIGGRASATDLTRLPATNLFPYFATMAGAATSDTLVVTADGAFGTSIDIYNGWILVNLTRKSALITDFTISGGLKEFHLNEGINNAQNDWFYIFKNTWDKVYNYNVINDVLRGGVGISPSNMPFYHTMIGTSSRFSPKSFGSLASGYVMYEQEMIRPGEGFETSVTILHQVYLTTIAATNTGPIISDNTYHYKMSLIYDGFQETEMTQSFKTFVAQGATSPALILEAISPINRRIEKVNIYRSTDTSGPFSYIDTVSINTTSWTGLTLPGTISEIAKAVSYIDHISGISVGDNYNDITGRPENSDVHLLFNYKHETHIAERRFIADVTIQKFDAKDTSWPRDSVTHYENRVYWSHITPKLVICPDIFLENNFMVFESRTGKITGIARVLNNLIVFLEDETYVVRIGGGSVLNWEKIETISGIGCVASGSVVDAQGSIIFAGRDNIYAFNLTAPVPLLDNKFEEDYQAISGKSTGVAIYYPKRRQYQITFNETETSINGTASSFIRYVIDLNTGAVHKHLSTRDTVSFAIGVDGELFRTDGAIIMKDDDSSMTESIGIGKRSPMIDAGTPDKKRWMNILLHYQSDDDIKVKLYLRRENEGRLGTAIKTITFPARAGSMTTKVIEINEDSEALQFEIFTANSTNTTVKIGQIGLEYEQSERATA